MRILIADDDPVSLSILRLLLEAGGHRNLVPVTDGSAAWSELDRDPSFELCILDIMMPEIDGLELAGRLRKDKRFDGIKVILCTALSDRPTVQRAVALGVDGFIVKPYSRERVLEQMRKLGPRRTAAGCEPAAVVARRLGVEPAQVEEFLERFQNETAEFVRSLPEADIGDARPLLIRTNALKGAAINLGASQLAESLGRLELALQAGRAGAAEAVRIEEDLRRMRERRPSAAPMEPAGGAK